MKSLIDDLKRNILGEIVVDQTETKKYETDESIFCIQPQIVVRPKNVNDVEILVQIATEYKVPITGRGGGSGIAGQSIGSGIVVDFSAMSKILDIHDDEIVVEPGVILKDLNERLAKTGKKYAPDPGSGAYCTIGGMISTNAAGPRALVHGSTRNHVVNLDLVLYDGQSISSEKLKDKFSVLETRIKSQKQRIVKAQRNVEKNSSGYDLMSIVQENPSYEKLFVGSEGTLGLVTKAALRLVDLPTCTHFAVFTFPSMKRAVMEVSEIRKYKPACIELLNESILQMLRSIDESFVEKLGMKNAGAALWVEWDYEIPTELKNEISFSTKDEDLIKKIWSERSKVSKYLHSQAEKNHRKPLRCIEDACVPIDKMVTFVDEVMCTLISHDCEGSIFGHVGSGHFHINPNIRVDLPDLTQRIHALMDEFYALVIELGGTISGEHGDGLLRTKYAHAQWKDIWDLFELVKHTFDPNGIFNPDKKVPVQPLSWPNFRMF